MTPIGITWDAGSAGLLADHVWQSTLFVALVALITLALRNNRAQVRYALWLAASMKFLIPFAPLVAFGSQFPMQFPATTTNARVSVIVDALSQPFAPGASAAVPGPSTASPAFGGAIAFLAGVIWLAGCALTLAAFWARWRQASAILDAASPLLAGREVDLLRALERSQNPAAGVRTPALAIVSSDAPLEPGIFGFIQPILFWPRSLTERLTDDQIEAILAHELAHVHRRDNVAAALHAVVQAVFWFHPLIWWLGARLVDERERACDEEVLRRGSAPQTYAEGILKACEFHIESPACMAGVMGSDLTSRIEHIMQGDPGSSLNNWRKLLLATAAAAALGAPAVFGALKAQAPVATASLGAPAAGDVQFETISIRPAIAAVAGPSGMTVRPDGRFEASNVTLRTLIANAYAAGPLQPLANGRIVGGPNWLDSDRFDIVATMNRSDDPWPDGPLQSMLRKLLTDQFMLVVHDESQRRPTYALVLVNAATGPRLQRSTADCGRQRGRGAVPPPPPPPPTADGRPRCGIKFLRGSISAGGITMAQFANAASRFAGRVVVDRSGLGGTFDLDLEWAPPTPPTSALPTILAAMEQQLSLRLTPQDSAIEVLVIERAQKPREYQEFVLAPPPPPPPPPAPPRR